MILAGQMRWDRGLVKAFVPLLLAAVLLGGAESSIAAAAEAELAQPGSVGFSSERLKRLEDMVQKYVDSKELPGAVTMLARHGKLVHYKTYGKKDLASGAPVEKDSIFRIFSMTKPVTGVAMMMLYEEGKWRPEDPLSRFIPEFKDLKVFKGTNNDGTMILEAPAHPPTVGELLNHTAGFTYGLFGATPVDKIYTEKGVLQSRNLQEMIDRVATIPLLYQPGSQWVYSISVDIQGYLVEKLSGKSLGDFFQERIFDPIGMKDTAFWVPAEKKTRLVTLYNANAKNELEPATFGMNYFAPPGMPSGGGGLVSTAQDYMLFGQMLLNKGQANGKRLLSPSSVALMSANHLPEKLLTGQYGIGQHFMRPGFGFGWDFAVFYDPTLAASTVGKGTYFWEGAAGTWFWVDPANDIVFVGMIQRMLEPRSPDVNFLSRAAVYQALVEP